MANVKFVCKYSWYRASAHIGKGMQWQMSSACPKVHQEWLGRGTIGVAGVVIHQLATHPAGKFLAREGKFSFTLQLSPRETIVQELQTDLYFQFSSWIL